MSAVLPESVFRARDGVLAQRSAGKFVLFDVEEGEYFTLNEVGTRLWELIDGAISVRAISAVIAGEYDVPADLIEQDVSDLVAELSSKQLLILVNPA